MAHALSYTHSGIDVYRATAAYCNRRFGFVLSTCGRSEPAPERMIADHPTVSLYNDVHGYVPRRMLSTNAGVVALGMRSHEEFKLLP